MKVMKFGGSSVADAQRIAVVAEIALKERKKTPIVLVLSAMKGNTDALIACARQAEQGDSAYKKRIEALLSKHAEAAQSLLADPDELKAARAEIDEMFRELESILHGIELVRECSARSLDLVMSFGDRLNCKLMTRYLNASGHTAEYIDTREVIVTDDAYGAAAVDYPLTYERLGKRIAACGGIPVVTGFIAATPEGITTTLGRNGSDFTASIVGAAINAELIEIWTDVDGVLSADPRLVPDAFVIPEVSVEEAMELSYFGAKVIHPYTMIPAVEKEDPHPH
jgi:aspartokinase/homoserine dehydrogenase 1